MGEQDKLRGALGLCARAGKLVYGIPMICEALKKGGRSTPAAVFEAADTGANSHKRIEDRCRFYRIPLYRLPLTMAQLSETVGKAAPIGAVAVTDAGMAEMVNSKRTNETI